MRGAFTGADRDRAGLIETTDGGTLFLDEIGEMPLAAQAKLLRFLQEGEFRRVGDTVNRTADVRIVTRHEPQARSGGRRGPFREDLYYRIRGVEVALPPLRERGDDIPLLARALPRRGAREASRRRVDVRARRRGDLLAYAGRATCASCRTRSARRTRWPAKRRRSTLEHLPERLRERRGATVARLVSGRGGPLPPRPDREVARAGERKSEPGRRDAEDVAAGARVSDSRAGILVRPSYRAQAVQPDK